MTKFIVIAFAVVLMLTGATVSVMKWMQLGPFAEQTEEEAKQNNQARQQPIYVDMPPLIINIFNGENVGKTVQIQVKIEVMGSQNSGQVNRQLPRLTDAFVRDLHAFLPRIMQEEEKLDVFVIKKRLQIIADKVLEPGIVNDVLIQSVTDE